MRAEYPREKRITRQPEFRSVLQQGKRVRASGLDVRWLASPLGYVRVGLIVPLHGQSAVQRNRLKRRLRELVRTEMLAMSVSADVVLRCRPGTYARTFGALKIEIVDIARQILEQAGRGGAG